MKELLQIVWLRKQLATVGLASPKSLAHFMVRPPRRPRQNPQGYGPAGVGPRSWLDHTSGKKSDSDKSWYDKPVWSLCD